MTEAEIAEMIESRRHEVDAVASWTTPAGNPRKAPIYEATIENDYLGKQKTIKAKHLGDLQTKVNRCITAWVNEELKKRVVAAKRDAKERTEAEAKQLDEEAKANLDELRLILAATLSVDDKINWDAERDTRKFRRFSFSSPPTAPNGAC